jgi:hypothetical protein
MSLKPWVSAIFVPVNNNCFDNFKLINLVELLYIYIIVLESRKLSFNK